MPVGLIEFASSKYTYLVLVTPLKDGKYERPRGYLIFGDKYYVHLVLVVMKITKRTSVLFAKYITYPD